MTVMVDVLQQLLIDNATLKAENSTLKADAARWRCVRSRGWLTLSEEGVPVFLALFDEDELPDGLYAELKALDSDEAISSRQQLDDVLDFTITREEETDADSTTS